ncbi:MAG: DUF3341 domain-containing protein [Bdellovibrionaceae bacterium]|nr:DUF3341 domain-containing protein [Pseudobdellovibrionaceae bacterium]MBX3033494.1 DUF3341 domain-containing protein [Pseudobdellovibrionaceae bacterium]
MAKKATGGLAAIFHDEKQILQAATRCREMGLSKFDAVTPYPVHGMEEAIGIKRSAIPYVTFVGALIGCSVGLFITVWCSAVSWPINIGGKPMISLPAFIPIMFELTILFAALSSVAAFAWLCRLPKMDPVVIDPDLTSHKFAIFVPEHDTGYDSGKLEQVFKDLGAAEVKRMAEY